MFKEKVKNWRPIKANLSHEGKVINSILEILINIKNSERLRKSFLRTAYGHCSFLITKTR